MSANEYKHKVLTIKLCMEPPSTLKKTETNISNPASGDWDKNLASLLSKITKKFKFLKNMDESEWSISINNTIIDKSNSTQLKQILSLIPPIPVVEITKTVNGEDSYVISVHYEGKTFDYEIVKDDDESEWDEEIYQELQAAIRKEFKLECAFGLYQDIEGNHVDIDDSVDIADAFDEIESGAKQLLHLFVKVDKSNVDSNTFKLIYDNNSFEWKPANVDNDDEKLWQENYNVLLSDIKAKYEVNNIQLQQIDNLVDIEDAEELMEAWKELVSDEENNVLEIKISGDLVPNEGDGDYTKQEEGAITDVAEEKPFNTELSQQKLKEYKEWFHNILGLPEYYNQFVEAGYQDLSFFDEDIDEDELINDIGIRKKPHRKKILKEIKRLLQMRKLGVDQLQGADVEKDSIVQHLAPNSNDKSIKSLLKESESVVIDEIKDPGTNDRKHDFDDDEKQEMDDTNTTEYQEEEKKMTMEEALSSLGSKIGGLPEEKQKLCYKTIKSMKEQAQPDDEDAAAQFQVMLGPISEQESAKFIDCVVGFLKILGYSVSTNPSTAKHMFEIKGKSTKATLSEVSSKFRHLVDAMQDPSTNVYQDLKLKIPKDSKVREHETGIYDTQFIIFELAQILMENQQTSLVNKTVLYPQNLERFINFLSPESSKNLCKDIYFDKLEPLEVSSIGLFGSREEVLNMLIKYNTISKTLYDTLIKDETNEYIQSGIHALLPINLQENKQNIKKWDHVIYFFYWSLPNSFDMNKMKAVRKMRKDPSCLLSRVLYEISSTVCIQVSSAELNDFGVMKTELMDSKEDDDDDDDDGIETITFKLEETKENHIMCHDADTSKISLKTYSKKHSANCGDLFLLNGINLSGYVRLFTQKARTVQDPKIWTHSSKKKLYEKIKLLDAKWTIKWDAYFSNGNDQKYMVVESILPQKYQQYVTKRRELRRQKTKELNDGVLEMDAESKLEYRSKLILQEYFNLYIRRCKSLHNQLTKIVNELDNQLENDLYSVLDYIDMEYKELSLGYDIDYNERYWRNKILSELIDGIDLTLSIHSREIGKIHKYYEKAVKDIKSRKKPKLNSEKSLGGRVWNNVKHAFVDADEDEIILAQMTKNEWEQYIQSLIDHEFQKAKRLIFKQNNVTIQHWLDKFERKYRKYKNKVYNSFLSKYTIKNNIKSKITKEYQQKQNKLEMDCLKKSMKELTDITNAQIVSLTQTVE
eukprot:240736_1